MVTRLIAPIVCLLALMVSMVQAQESTIDMTIHVDNDSFTVLIPGEGVVSLVDVGFRVVQPDGAIKIYMLRDCTAFAEVHAPVRLPLCLRLERFGSESPLPLECSDVPTLHHTLSDADVFWYDSEAGNARTFSIVLTEVEPVAMCPAGPPSCSIELPMPPTPIPTITPEISPTLPPPVDSNTALPTHTLAPTGMPAFTPVLHNADWTPVTETFNGVEMVLVPPGCFMMGSTEAEIDAALAQCNRELGDCQREWFEMEGPATQVCFDRPFWIDRMEVSNQVYGSTSGAFSGSGSNHPRENVSWFDARSACERRGGRLPTEAEWEYAAAGPDDLAYPWGNDFLPNNVVYLDNSQERTWEVDSHHAGASWVGALNMAGNLREWTGTIFRAYPYAANDGREDLNDNTGQRAVRGGSWFVIPVSLRAADRVGVGPMVVDWNIGFRCARSSE